MNGHIAQLRFFHIYVLEKPWDKYQVPFRRINACFPDVPTQAEVFEFISGIKDIRDKALISLMYSSGLRVSELCSLRYQDISRSEMRIFVRDGKNRSDGFTILSPASLEILTMYWRERGKPKAS